MPPLLRRAAAVLLLLVAVAGAAGLAAPALAALEFPPLTGRVVDRAELLSAEQERRLTAKLESHEKATSNQLVVVTLPSLQGTAIDDFGYQLGRHWGIGQEGRDNGVLLIVAPNERQVRIEVGYGLEGDLPDATANTIITNEILPAFRRGDYPGGIAAGVDAIVLAIAGAYEPLERNQSGGDEERAAGLFTFLVVMMFFVLFLHRRGGGGLARGLLIGGALGGRGRRGGFGGGGFGGGGFGGGGGGFGGGGSSGRW